MHSYASLVHTLGCIDSHASIRILESLRLGEYDLALLGSSHTSQATASIDSVYPWEDFPIEYQHQSEPNSNILPSIYTSLSVRYTGATYSAMLTNRSRRCIKYPSNIHARFALCSTAVPSWFASKLQLHGVMLRRHRLRCSRMW